MEEKFFFSIVLYGYRICDFFPLQIRYFQDFWLTMDIKRRQKQLNSKDEYNSWKVNLSNECVYALGLSGGVKPGIFQTEKFFTLTQICNCLLNEDSFVDIIFILAFCRI